MKKIKIITDSWHPEINGVIITIYDAIKFNIEHRTFNRTHYDELYDIKQKIPYRYDN